MFTNNNNNTNGKPPATTPGGGGFFGTPGTTAPVFGQSSPATAPAPSGGGFFAAAAAAGAGGTTTFGSSSTTPAPGPGAPVFGGFSASGGGETKPPAPTFAGAPATGGFGSLATSTTTTNNDKKEAPPTAATNMFGGATSLPAFGGNDNKKKDDKPAATAGFGFPMPTKAADASAPKFSGFGKVDAGTTTAAPAPTTGAVSTVPAFGFPVNSNDKKDTSSKPPATANTGAPAASVAPTFGTAATAAPPTGGFPLNAATASTPGPTTAADSKNPPSTPTVATTPATPAPIQTPGTATGAATTNAAAASSTPATPAPAANAATKKPPTYQEPLLLDVKNMTIEQILNAFQEGLERDALDFVKDAKRVAEYDATLRDARRDIVHLTEQTHRCAKQQSELEQTLTAIGDMEEELDKTLEELEVQVDDLFNATSNLSPTEADQRRDEAFDKGSLIERRLTSMVQSLEGTMEQIEAAEQRMFASDPNVGPIVRDLYEHQRKLQDLQTAGQTLHAEITHVQQRMPY